MQNAVFPCQHRFVFTFLNNIKKIKNVERVRDVNVDDTVFFFLNYLEIHCGILKYENEELKVKDEALMGDKIVLKV